MPLHRLEAQWTRLKQNLNAWRQLESDNASETHYSNSDKPVADRQDRSRLSLDDIKARLDEWDPSNRAR